MNPPVAVSTVSRARWSSLRTLFPVTDRYAYFNVAANAPLPIPVVRAMARYAEDLADHGSRHYLDWFAVAKRTRSRAAALLNARSDEIALVRNTSDGLSIVAHGLDWKKGDSVVLVNGDFPANIYPWLRLRELGVEVRLVRPDDRHRIHPEQLLAACDGSTRLIAVSFVSFANGFRFDIRTLSQMAKPRGILVCIDAIQGLGALRLDVVADGIDFLAADGHKWLLTPEGIGIFYVKKSLLDRLRPPLVSWLSMKQPFDTHYRGEMHDDARRFEFATPNTAGVYALDAALELITNVASERPEDRAREGDATASTAASSIREIESRVLHLTDLMVEGLRSRGCRVLSPRGELERSGIVSFEKSGLDSNVLTQKLLDAGIQTAMRAGAVRAAAHFYNDETDVERLLSAIPR